MLKTGATEELSGILAINTHLSISVMKDDLYERKADFRENR